VALPFVFFGVWVVASLVWGLVIRLRPGDTFWLVKIILLGLGTSCFATVALALVGVTGNGD
jgi:hypothetical protein